MRKDTAMKQDAPATPDDYRRMVYEVAQAIAPGWERQRARIEGSVTRVREWMVTELAPRPGDTVLELAAGVGDTGFEAARLIGDGGRLISSDFSPHMVEAARRRGEELGLKNVDYRVIDAERIELDADSVDGVLCRCGYMLMADPARALSETRRVLRPSGRVAMSVWGAAESNPWMTALGRILVEEGHAPPPEPGGPDPFGMTNVERTLREEAGFTAVRVEEVPVRFRFADVDDYLDYAADTAGPLALVVRELSAADREALGIKLQAAFAPFATADGYYELPGVSLNAVAS